MATHSKHELSSLQAACLEFERDWAVGVRPGIEEYLTRYASLDRSAVFQNLLEIEIRYRLLNKEQPTFEEYVHRFPKDVLLVKRVLDSKCSLLDSTKRGFGSSVEEASASSSDSFEVSAKWIDRFEVIRELGSGGFGCVYLAFDRNVEREVAIKVLHAERQWDKAIRETFILEAQAQAKVDHPHVLPIYAVEQIPDSDAWYIVSKYVAGGTLKDRLEAEPRLSVEEIVKLTIPLAEALHAMHTRGLYHRDVKPSNVLFDAKGQVYLADFGLVVNERDQFRTRGQVAGSPSYMAPEQVQGKSHLLDGRADIWSLGVVLYEMLAGARPFRGPSLTQLSEEILERQPRPLRLKRPDVSRELERIVLKCLQKDATKRYLTAQDLAADLERFLNRSRSHPSQMPPSESTGGNEAQRLSRYGIAAGLGLAAILAGAVFAWKAGSAPSDEIPPVIPPAEKIAPLPGAVAPAEASDPKKLLLEKLEASFWEDGFWVLEKPQNMVRAFSREPSMRSLGEAQNQKLKFRIDIPELEEDAKVGLFFGFRITGAAIEKKAKWQLVSLRRYTGNEFVLLITAETQSKAHRGTVILAKWRGNLPPEELDLSLEVGPGGVEKVIVADVAMDQLVADFHKEKRPGFETAGRFGLVCLQGGGAFANPVWEGRVCDFDVPGQE